MKTFQQVFDDYTSAIGDPTLASLAELREAQRACVEAEDPNLTCFVLDLRRRAEHVWSHNVKRHFGSDEITLAQFTDRIHPRWQQLHHAAGAVFFRYVIEELPGNHRLVDDYEVYIPLLSAGGDYWWYRASSRPVTFTDAGNAVHYLRKLRLFCRYDHFAPPRPRFRLRPPRAPVTISPVSLLDAGQTEAALLKGLPPSELRLLTVYRSLAEPTESGWRIPDKEAVGKEAGMSRSAVNKAGVRLMRAARPRLPRIATGEIGDLVTFLNDIFGAPERKN